MSYALAQPSISNPAVQLSFSVGIVYTTWR